MLENVLYLFTQFKLEEENFIYLQILLNDTYATERATTRVDRVEDNK